MADCPRLTGNPSGKAGSSEAPEAWRHDSIKADLITPDALGSFPPQRRSDRPRFPQHAPQQLQDRRIRPSEIELADFLSGHTESGPQLIVRPQERRFRHR
jgi:hypothetical protein